MAASVSHDGPSFGRGRRKADAPARRGAGQGSAPGGTVAGPAGSPRISEGRGLAGLLFVAPALTVSLVFVIIPFANTVRLSFTDATFSDPGSFVGLDNWSPATRGCWRSSARRSTCRSWCRASSSA